MARIDEPLEEMYANLVIEDEEMDEIVIANNTITEQKTTFMLMGKFLTEKTINFQAMKNLMESLWRPREGMEVYSTGDLKYLFVFYHKMDVQNVMEGGPWSFEQAMLVLHQVEMGDDPATVKLQNMEMWVQIYDLPRGYVSESILESVRASLGTYIKSGPGTFDGGWTPYVRIRVALNVDKPLKRSTKIKREGNSWSWINFKYEKLGTFCFVCGIIGHSDRDCIVVYVNLEKVVEKMYGVWQRASSKRGQRNPGSKWLRNSGVRKED
ncbi:uncharacterized protein At4g02000-like [Apium graveolens]|uniref:uncharacterized protein At4g02000-like n=1 Tax=Apium graveolens TaxID=4045 RepID=UPI003D7BDDAB